MKVVLLSIFAAFAVSISVSDLDWKTNIEVAKENAAASNKLILLSFSGSDWCSNCIRLEKTLFESEEFKVFASENFVLLQADFPSRKANKLSKEQTAHNEALAEKYNKSGKFPSVLVLNAQGDVLGKLEHPKDNAADYIKNLESIIPQ